MNDMHLAADLSPAVDARVAPRVQAIDLLRGLAVIGMIMVAYAGDWEHRFTVLTHADWRGFALADMIFPSFLFCVGAALPFSLGRRAQHSGDSKAALIGRVLWRSIALILLGIVLNALPAFDWANVRLMGILQRIGLCYAAVGTVCVLIGHRSGRGSEGAGGSRFALDPKPLIAMAVLLLVGYGALLLGWEAPGCGAGCFDSAHSLPTVIDRAVFGIAHLWLYGTTNGVVTFDPEGLVSTLGALFNVVLGVLATLTLQRRTMRSALVALAASGVLFIVLGLAIDGYVPVVKKIWTPTFALMSGGFSVLAFVALALRAPSPDARWTTPILVYGSNATAAFVGITLLDTLMQLPLLRTAAGATQSLHDGAAAWLGSLISEPRIASAAYSAVLLLVLGIGLWQLYQRRIFLKI